MRKTPEHKQTATRIRSNAGFSFIELSIVIIVFGLFLTVALHLYTIHAINQDYETTRENIVLAQDAVTEFYGLYGRYPCPADPSLLPGDANYGEASCRASITDACPTGLKCVTVGSRDADGDGANDPVLIGALPIMTLVNNDKKKIPIEAIHGYDGFNMKLAYAVSELMTDQGKSIVDPANPHLGAIDMRDENNNSMTEPPASTHFAIFSYGQNKVGATPRNSKDVVEKCTSPVVSVPGNPPDAGPNIGSSGIKIELENCDGNDAIFVSGLRSLANTDDYYDDVLYFTASATSPLWLTSLNSPVGLTWIYNTNLGHVGIGTETPGRTLEVNGDIRSEDDVMADDGFCNYARLPDHDPSDTSIPDECLDPFFIAGPSTVIGSDKECPSGWIATGIENNALVCEPLLTGPIAFSCPAGTPVQYLKGFTIKRSNPGTGPVSSITPICSTL